MKSKINPFRSSSISGAAVVFACFSLLNTGAKAIDYFWTGANTSNQYENGNWLGGTPPGSPPEFDFNPWIFGSDATNSTMVMNLTNANSGIVVNSGIGFDMTFNGPGTIKMIGSIDMSTAAHDLTINAPLAWLFDDITLNVGPSRTLTVNGGLTSDPGFGDLTNHLVKSGAGTAVLASAATTILDTTISGGTLQIAGAGTINGGSYSGAISIATGANLKYSSSAAQTFSGVISGAGSLTKDTSSSTLTLSAANTYGGTTTVSAGTLQLNLGGGAGTLGGDGPIVINNGGTLLGGENDALGFFNHTANNTVTINQGGTLSVASDKRLSLDRNLTVTGGTITSQGAGDAFGSYTMRDFAGASYHFTSALDGTASVFSAQNITLHGPVTFNVTQGGGPVDLNVSGSLKGFFDPGSIVKTGNGVMVLSGVNTYSGTTAVNEGTLVINGSISTSVLTTVASGATLGGSGTVGALTIDSGAFVTPGNSPGILTVNGNYIQAGQYTAEIAGTTAGSGYDQIGVTGSVDITGGSLVALFSGAGYSMGNLLFILLNDSTDAITGTYSGYAQGATVITYGGFDWQISYLADSTGNTFTGGNDIALMAVPEPNIAALIGGFGVLALLRRRR